MNEQEQIERIKLQDQLHKGMMDGSPRYNRARRFTSQILHLMQDFIPQERGCMRRMEEFLMEAAFSGNIEIVNVPPECDEMDKLALEKRMIETASRKIFIG